MSKLQKREPKTNISSRQNMLIRVGMAVIITLLILSPLAYSTFFPAKTKTFLVNPTQDKIFEDRYTKYADINSGITIRIFSSYDSPTTNSGIFAEYVVYNHTKESIVFPNTGFGLQIFTPKTEDNSWKEVKQLIPFTVNPTTIMSDGKVFDSFGNVQINHVLLQYRYLEQDLPANFRFYVTGVGQKTGVRYVAYVDLSLNR